MWCLWVCLAGKVVERGGVESWGGLVGAVGRIMVVVDDVVVGGWGRGGGKIDEMVLGISSHVI